ncbi:Na(+) H(+) antiporter [Lacticaseibacillus pantheris DSM 15945 = JCM 12539 = NBRC 106106]|uniref:Na(+) H(+) antiporter n=1 Tax=Lacticaseibacillus pantheris DSM 15945 = JCM 12539 = NBRC 106106 TaxID=1423783 RepID=A0A0R1TTQ0_9LACO|nr:cation:proton antiporter [Lacticaseibacillus pantheris]KRL84681.1 Na(+) H(+) antiporter [Lacticaseibacillus pantheris DSM 15945 = JCM 12539 = NBRC 106106]
MHFIGTLTLLLITTLLAGHLGQRAGLPAVVPQILVGVLLGPAMLGWVHASTNLTTFADIGVVILMFLGGMESDIDLLKRYLRPALIVACAGVIMPVALIGLASRFFGVSWTEAAFIGVIFSATSVSISVAVLKEFHYLDTREGATILGAAVADDIIGVILLSVMIAILGGEGMSTGGHQSNLVIVLAGQVAFFAFVYVLIRWVTPFLLHFSDRLMMTSSSTIMAMVICLGTAWLAEEVGLSGAVGAFFAGIAVAQTDYKAEALSDIEPLGYATFIPLFFVSVGLNVRFDGIGRDWLFILVLSVLGVLTKLWGCGLGARISGFQWLSANVIGSGMISRGEMGLITAQIGFAAGLLREDFYSAIILAIIIVTMIAPFMLKRDIVKQQAYTASE